MGRFSWGELSWYSRAAILTVALQAIVVAGLEGYLAGLIIPAVDKAVGSGEIDEIDSANLSSIRVYVILFITSQLFAIYFLTDGVLHKNTMQIIAFVALSVCVVGYSIFQVDQLLGREEEFQSVDISSSDQTAITSTLYAMTVVAAIGTLISGFLAFKLYGEFGWQIYKRIGADPKLRTIFRTYQTLIMFMKIDLFFGLLFSIQYLVLVLERDDYEYYVTIVALILTPIMLIGATYGLRKENRPIMYAFFLAIVGYMVYFSFKVVTMYTNPTRERNGEEVNIYRGAQKFLTFFGAIAIIIILITLVNAIMCFRNFGQGLKAHVLGSNRRTAGAGYPVPAVGQQEIQQDSAPLTATSGTNMSTVDQQRFTAMGSTGVEAMLQPQHPMDSKATEASHFQQQQPLHTQQHYQVQSPNYQQQPQQQGGVMLAYPNHNSYIGPGADEGGGAFYYPPQQSQYGQPNGGYHTGNPISQPPSSQSWR